MSEVPQNATAEKSALSMLSCSPRLVAEMPWTEDMFLNPTHRTIFRAIESAAQSGEPGDLVALTARLEATGQLDGVGGAAGVTDILTTLTATHPQQAAYYRQQLVEARNYRDTLRAVTLALPEIAAMRIPLPELVERIAAAADHDQDRKSETLAQQMDGLFAELERSEPQEAFSTGLPSLDRHLSGGIHRKQMTVVAGETGGGKSILLALAALANAQIGRSVAIFSLEMPARDILKRMAANLAGLPIKAAHEKPEKEEQEKLDRISRALIGLTSLPLTIIDTMTSLAEIEAEARRLARLGKADLIVVDYLQLIANEGPDSREQAISEIARKLKNLALSSGSAVITASQLNEDGKLRESRAIGHHADHVLIIGDGKITIAKNRNGQANVSAQVTMRGELGRFDEGKA